MASGLIQTGSSEREAGAGAQARRQFVGFRLHGEEYAIAITEIREIILMKPITRLPQVPDSIEGLINLRGHVIPLVNLRRRFGLSFRPFDDETRIIVVSIAEKTVGFIVDEVTQVMRISSEQIQAVPISTVAATERFIHGLAKLEDRLLIILNTSKLFNVEEFEFSSDSNSPSAVPSPESHPESAG